MDHSEAASGQAVERYLLGEMAEPEAEAFEQHFFECTVCTEKWHPGRSWWIIYARRRRRKPVVRLPPGRSRPATHLGNGGDGRYSPRRPLPPSPWHLPWRTRRVELARLDQPQALLAYTLKSASRGERNRILLQPGASRFAISLELTDSSFPAYRCAVYDSSGSRALRRYRGARSGRPAESPRSGAKSWRREVISFKVFGLRGSLAGRKSRTIHSMQSYNHNKETA